MPGPPPPPRACRARSTGPPHPQAAERCPRNRSQPANVARRLVSPARASVVQGRPCRPRPLRPALPARRRGEAPPAGSGRGIQPGSCQPQKPGAPSAVRFGGIAQRVGNGHLRPALPIALQERRHLIVEHVREDVEPDAPAAALPRPAEFAFRDRPAAKAVLSSPLLTTTLSPKRSIDSPDPGRPCSRSSSTTSFADGTSRRTTCRTPAASTGCGCGRTASR